MPALDVLKRLDAYPKLSFEEMAFRSVAGAAVTIASSLVICLLILFEVNAYWTLDVSEELFVDTTRNHKLQINLDITMPRISCDYLSLDAMALDGEQHLHIEHNIFKRRLDLNGVVITDAKPEKEDVQATTKKNGTIDEGAAVGKDVSSSEKIAEKTTEKCASCYGAKNRTCCNTCQVRTAQEWAIPDADIR